MGRAQLKPQGMSLAGRQRQQWRIKGQGWWPQEQEEGDEVVWDEAQTVMRGSEAENRVKEQVGEEWGRWDTAVAAGMVEGRVGVAVREAGLLVYGAPMGSGGFVREALDKKAKEVEAVVVAATSMLAGRSKQALWQMLRLSLSQQFDYWLQNCYPTETEEAAATVDEALWVALEQCVGRVLVREGEAQWGGRSFTEFVVRQPSKLGGMGLRSCQATAKAAFVGAMDSAVRHFADSSKQAGLCPQLEHVVGKDFEGRHYASWLEKGGKAA